MISFLFNFFFFVLLAFLLILLHGYFWNDAKQCETAEAKTLLPFSLPAFFSLAKFLQRAKKFMRK
jgi:hypothetical protein